MALFALADTHLSLASGKPMDVFGQRWHDHTERIAYFWNKTVGRDDAVVIPGDVSWGMTLGEAEADLAFLDALPGRKILGKGNHDYWWSTASKINKFFSAKGFSTLSLLYNNAYAADGFAVCGSRGWYSDAASPPGTDRKKIVLREAGRLRRSLEAGKALGEKELLAFLHFPPVFGDFVCGELIAVLKEYGVKRCFYGHMHGQYNIPRSFTYDGVEFIIVASDHLQFDPLPILPL